MHFSDLLILVIGLIMFLIILVIILTIFIIIIGLIWRIGYTCNRFVEALEQRFIRPTPLRPTNSSLIQSGINKTSIPIRSRSQMKPGDYVCEDGSRQSYFSPLEGRQLSSESAEPELNKNTIVIAVDAIPTRGGGLLILNVHKRIYFYSVDWSKKLKFPEEPDKFEMVNAFLALISFRKYVKDFKNQDTDCLVLKCDNTIAESPETVFANGLKRKIYRPLFEYIDQTLKSLPFCGSWKYLSRNYDFDIAIADKLSRQKNSAFSKIPYYDFYQQENISNYSMIVLDVITDILPDEWKK